MRNNPYHCYTSYSAYVLQHQTVSTSPMEYLFLCRTIHTIHLNNNLVSVLMKQTWQSRNMKQSISWSTRFSFLMEYLFLCETIHTINTDNAVYVPMSRHYLHHYGVFVPRRNNPYHLFIKTTPLYHFMWKNLCLSMMQAIITIDNGVFVPKRNNPYHFKISIKIRSAPLVETMKALPWLWKYIISKK